MSDPRHRNRYRVKRAEFIKASAMVCHWCGCEVFDTVPTRHPRKATIDHLVEVDRASSMAMDVSLWVVACGRCNASRGATYGNRKRGAIRKASRNW